MINAWRLRQFEYSWLRNSIGRYADFWTVTSEALVFAARLAKLDMSKEKRDQLMNGFLDMKAYPDVQPAKKYSHTIIVGPRLVTMASGTSSSCWSSV